MDCGMPGFPVLHHLPNLLKLMSIEFGDAIRPPHPLLPPSPPDLEIHCSIFKMVILTSVHQIKVQTLQEMPWWRGE